MLELWINARGVVTDVRVIESTGCEELDRSAVDAIRKAQFMPELSGDGLLAARVTQRVRFELKG